MPAAPQLQGAPPWTRWSLEEWTAYRDRAAAYLARDPGWIVGPAVVSMANYHVARLGGTP